ncbi:unnamed protein product [Arabidopsis thaliana]|uniref:Gb/AAD18119.1 n=1 Tax=Arabidopsis thaliana TaxID=3702 RepID=Q9FG51_ARATH|nr:RING/U-box superfamily protein [Arabidopsis thaliana]AED94152.1 RING/U-box superfamily protein [Arabidopsis thaliana]BAB11642.1 unnamed protein product [Arabidopsis thaliana]|eukprot:NP_198536.1 RING/U-box superfamily protein [Arabidopsis thaliana]
METETLRTIEVSTMVSNRPKIVGVTNTVLIYQEEEIEELIEYESGIVANLGWYTSPLETNAHILLNPRRLTRRVLTQLLDDQFLGQKIAHDVKDSFANDNSLRQPVTVTVYVTYIKERRVIFPHGPSLLSRGASGEVFHRLVEEQRVESADLEEEDETCSICIEKFSESHEDIIRVPDCLHLFHQGCLFEWLGLQNSCPLCRKVPYEEEDEDEDEEG